MFETAMAASTNPADFELKLRMFGRLSQSVQMAAVTEAEEQAMAAPAVEEDRPSLDGVQTGGFNFLGQ
jgi:hypothetical protein